MKRLLLLFLLSGCAGQIKELKDTNESQSFILRSALNRINILENRQDDYWIRENKLELKIDSLEEKLKLMEYILDEYKTKCPR